MPLLGGVDQAGPLALAGRIVTMDARRTVLRRGVVYVRDGVIVAVENSTADPPAGFENVPVTRTSGTICPGLIELHNHLPYDVLPLWAVPKKYANRDQWSSSSSKDYRRLVSGPMGVLGRNPDVVPAIVRYVEVRALLGGTTTSQGIALAVNAGIVRLFRGLVRNVESTGDKTLPPATTHIADVDSTDAERFLQRLSGKQKMLLHLSEGTDDAARAHFQSLQISPGRWAITQNLIGIHCAALTAADFDVLAEHGGSMVWSPLSNLLLYGKTAAIKSALSSGVPLALGSDWAPSGSKHLLGELKVARLAARSAGAELGSADLLAMATCTPAAMLGWQAALGSLEPGKKADLVAIDGATGDPYDTILDATEHDVNLVVIDGVPRAGTSALMRALHVDGEHIRIGRRTRVLNLAQASADPDVAQVSVAQAMSSLREAMHDLPNPPAMRPSLLPDDHRALLALPDVISIGLTARPHLPYRGRLTALAPPVQPTLAAAPEPLPSLPLDPLTAIDNPAYWTTLAAEPNLPDDIKDGLTEGVT